MKIKGFFLFLLPFALNAWAADCERTILIDGPEVDLTLCDLQKTLLSAPKEIRSMALVYPEKIREIVNSTYATKVAAHRAKQKHLDQNPEVAAQIWNRTLNLLADAELNEHVKSVLAASDQDFEKLAYEAYLAQQDRYKVPEKAAFSHILLKVPSPEKESEVKARIEEIRQEIESGAITFEEAAKRYSNDKRSAVTGGKVGLVERGKVIKSIEEALFSSKEGQLVGPIKTRYGYHLLRVDERRSAHLIPFEKVKEKLIKEVKKKREADIRQDYWFKIEGDPKVKINREAIEAFSKNPVLY